jgi:glycosyltransferase involved in cell wall biosynthesis
MPPITPVTVPMVLMVYDMIPEVLNFDLSHRAWKEKQTAISYADAFACISDSTRRDLDRYYPGTLQRADVTYCGVDHDIFTPRAEREIAGFKQAFDVRKPYYLLVGAREQHLNYKNGILAFQAAQRMRDVEFELLCVGGEPSIQESWLAELPSNVSARRIGLTDSELACAYSGAEALLFPSFYEGFGMPVAEAMACACPVVTTRSGSLEEVAGDAAVFVSGRNAEEMAEAMRTLRQPAVRQDYVNRGLAQARKFSWDAMAAGVHKLLTDVYKQRDNPDRRRFKERWKQLRSLQALVDPT